jgi:ABC-type uncharacterized transport system permease subunit
MNPRINPMLAVSRNCRNLGILGALVLVLAGFIISAWTAPGLKIETTGGFSEVVGQQFNYAVFAIFVSLGFAVFIVALIMQQAVIALIAIETRARSEESSTMADR